MYKRFLEWYSNKKWKKWKKKVNKNYEKYLRLLNDFNSSK